MPYERIRPLSADFSDAEAASVESLRDAWIEQKDSLSEGGALDAFHGRLVRRWSIETGIVERLYTLDRGTTELLVNQGLDAALVQHGASDMPAAELITILEDHRDAAAYVVDHVAQDLGLTAHFIRSVHALLTKSQGDVEAEDQFGRRLHTPLLKGEWKKIPNNPRRPDGAMHEYCPPALVNEEMENLIKFYDEMVQRGVDSVTCASWLHHRFTQIHPFQDGNGRVARALTAMVFVTNNCFPIIVDRDIRDQYIAALETADAGEIRPLVRMFARLQKVELEQALSISENVLNTSVPIGGTLRAKLLAALRDRARERRQALKAKRQQVLAKGNRIFEDAIVPLVHDVSESLAEIFAQELPGSNVRVELSDDQKKHYFKSQIVKIAQQEHYYVDLSTIHKWVRLRLQRPDELDNAVDEIVISMHSLGRQFTGVLVISAYFAKRFIDETDRSISLDPHRLAERSLTFSYLEEETNIANRAREWTNAVLDVGLAQLHAII